MTNPRCLVLALLVGCATRPTCTPEGATYTARQKGAACCDGLERINLMFEPSETYEGSDLPEGCGVGPAPPTVMVCIACGDGICGTAEHFCNCPEDCPP